MISLLLPTRGRPDFFGSMLETAYLTTSPGSVEAVAYVDEDDPAAGYYEKLATTWAERNLHVRILTGPRLVLSVAWNTCAEEAVGDLLMLAADDIRFRHPGWDEAVETVFAAIPDRIAYVYGNDDIHNFRLGTHGIVSDEWRRAVGYFVPPYFTSDYNDAWLHDVARMAGRAIWLPQLHTEHLHPAVGKAAEDLTHRERGARAEKANVHHMYPAMADLRWQDAQKLIAAITAHEEKTR